MEKILQSLKESWKIFEFVLTYDVLQWQQSNDLYSRAKQRCKQTHKLDICGLSFFT